MATLWNTSGSSFWDNRAAGGSAQPLFAAVAGSVPTVSAPYVSAAPAASTWQSQVNQYPISYNPDVEPVAPVAGTYQLPAGYEKLGASYFQGFAGAQPSQAQFLGALSSLGRGRPGLNQQGQLEGPWLQEYQRFAAGAQNVGRVLSQNEANQNAYKQALATYQKQQSTKDTSGASLTTTGQYQQAISEAQAAADAQKNALQAAQAQREALASQYGQREQELTRYLEGLGTAEKGGLERQRAAIMAQQQQDLLNRGMTSTTAYDAAMRGTNQAFNQDLSGLEERLQRQAMDYRTALSGETLGARSAAIEGASKSAAEAFAAQQLPIEYRGALAQQYGDLNKVMASQASQFATIGADRDLQMAKLAQEAQIANQQAALQKMGLDAETALGYAKLQNNIKVANAARDPLTSAKAAQLRKRMSLSSNPTWVTKSGI